MTQPLRTSADLPVHAQTTPAAWRVQSIDRAVHLLRAAAASGSAGAGTVALAATCGLNRATAWRILSTLESHDLVVCDRSTHHWTIGAGLLEIVRSSEPDAILRDAHAVLERLAAQTGETAALAVLRQGALVYVDEVASSSIVAATWDGQTMSLHATSTGKVLLAWTPADELAGMLPRRLRRFTDATITSRASLRKELALTRERGYATCCGEFDASAWGVSAPVLDPSGRLVAVLSLWGPGDRVLPARFPALGEAVMDAVRRSSV